MAFVAQPLNRPIALQSGDAQTRTWLTLPSELLVWMANLTLTYLAVTHTVEAVLVSPVNVDAGYYLAVLRRLQDGAVAYRDFPVGYTPLGIFFLKFSANLFSGLADQYALCLSTIFCFELLTAAAVAYLTRLFGAKIPISCLSAVLTFIGMQTHEGIYVFLEPMVIPFVLLAIILPLRWPKSVCACLCSGMCIGVAFLVKQYGIFGLIPALALSATQPVSCRRRVSCALALGMGAVVPLLILLLYFRVAYAVLPSTVFLTFWNPTYFQGIATLHWLKELLTQRCVYLLAVPLLFLSKAARHDRIFWTLLLAWVAMLLPALVRDYGHYYMLLVPETVLIGVYMHETAKRSPFSFVRPLCLVILAALLFPVIEYWQTPPLSKEAARRPQQTLVTAQINEVWPVRTAVLVFAEPWLSYSADFYPAAGLRMPYSFLSQISAAELVKAVELNSYILVDASSPYFTEERARIEEQRGEFFNFLKISGHCLNQTVAGRYQLWDRSCQR